MATSGVGWTGDPDLLWDGNPRSCDVTHDLRIAARAGDYFCVRLRGDPDANSRGDLYGAARFFSRDANENSIKSWWADFDPSSVFTMRGSMIGTPHALAPHLRINATQCGSVYPDKHGPGNCGPEWGAATDELFRTARPTPRPFVAADDPADARAYDGPALGVAGAHVRDVRADAEAHIKCTTAKHIKEPPRGREEKRAGRARPGRRCPAARR